MVTADTRALVCVWDAISGDKVMEFSANQSNEFAEPEVTAMKFDVTYRRLVTALNDGTLSIWNFNNGNSLRQVAPRPETGWSWHFRGRGPGEFHSPASPHLLFVHLEFQRPKTALDRSAYALKRLRYNNNGK